LVDGGFCELYVGACELYTFYVGFGCECLHFMLHLMNLYVIYGFDGCFGCECLHFMLQLMNLYVIYGFDGCFRCAWGVYVEFDELYN